ncbi:MAG: aminoacyl-tRNA hydrolase [candidate division Zixibacteria bacterium]|nr:aminoacyl-tRNA hydrolase [candidate division Zixibacteria bacterium]MCI0597233.1 aminoacyl-tRNA hydrolase [candidate division Zixibacteria bacterium]
MNTPLSLIVGLGNPGRQYAKTRHNLGWQVLDRLAEKLKIGFKAGKGEYYLALLEEKERDVFFLKPATYMNASGVAVKEALAFFGKTPADLLVILDDMALPLGKLRLRSNGSSGGHNGLESIIYQMQSEDFVRLRLGIGTPEAKEAAVGHVLGEFSKEEKKTAEEMMENAVVAVETCYQKGFQDALNYLSRRTAVLGEAAEE